MSEGDAAVDRGRGDGALAEENVVEEGLAIERHGQGLAHLNILEHGAVEVVAHRHDAVLPTRIVGRFDEVVIAAASETFQVRTGDLPQPVDFASLESYDLAGVLGNYPHNDFVEDGQAALEIVGVLL